MDKKRYGLFWTRGETSGGADAKPKVRPEGERIVMVDVEKIKANPNQPRKTFHDEAIEELSGSIREYGVLQPIILRAEEEGYTIIAGERRYRASQLAGLKEIPAIIRDMQHQEAALVSLVENVQREDLNFLEEARAYKSLMDDFGLTQTEIAEKVNKKQSTISNKIRILALPPDVQDKLIAHRLTERHARALLKLSDAEDRERVTDRVIENNLNVKQTEKLIEEVLLKKEEALRKKRKISYVSYKIYLNTLRKAFNQIKEMEKNAKFTQEDKGEYMEVKIILPKSDRCFT